MVLMTSFLAGAAGAVELVQNGGFETGDFTDWTLTGNTGATYVGTSPNAPHSGAWAAELGAVGSDDFMSQVLTTTAGQVYNLSFWHIYAPNAGPIGNFAVLWNNVAVFGPVPSQSPPTPQVWTQYNLQVTGTGSDTLTIESRNDPSEQGIDDISVTAAVRGGVPEPATWALLLSGFFGAGALLRRRRGAMAAA